MIIVLWQLRKNVTGKTDITRGMRHFVLGSFLWVLVKIFLGQGGNQRIDITINLNMDI